MDRAMPVANCGAGYDEIWIGGGEYGTIRVYSETDGRQLATISVPSRTRVCHFALCHFPDESSFWVACEDGSLHIVSISDQEVTASIRHAHSAPILDMQSTTIDPHTHESMHPDKVPAHVWTAAADGVIRVWSARTGDLIDTLTFDGDTDVTTRSLLFMPKEDRSERTMWAACSNGDVLVYETRALHLMGSVPTDLLCDSPVDGPGPPVLQLCSIWTSGTARGVCMVHGDDTVSLWSAEYKLMDAMKGTPARRICADGRRLYIICEDGTLAMTTVEHGRFTPVTTLMAPRPALDFCPADTGTGVYVTDALGLCRWEAGALALSIEPATQWIPRILKKTAYGVVAAMNSGLVLMSTVSGGILETVADVDLDTPAVDVAVDDKGIWVTEQDGTLRILSDRLRLVAKFSAAHMQRLLETDLELPPSWSPPHRIFAPRTTPGRVWAVVGADLLTVWDFRQATGSLELRTAVSLSTVHSGPVALLEEDGAGVWSVDTDCTVVVWDVPSGPPEPRCAFRPTEANGRPVALISTTHGVGLFLSDGVVHFLEYCEGDIALQSTVRILHDDFEGCTLHAVHQLHSGDIVVGVTDPTGTHKVLLFNEALILHGVHSVEEAVTAGTLYHETLVLGLGNGQLRVLHSTGEELAIDHIIDVHTRCSMHSEVDEQTGRRVFHQRAEVTVRLSLGEVARMTEEDERVPDVHALEGQISELHEVVEAETRERERFKRLASSVGAETHDLRAKLEQAEAALAIAQATVAQRPEVEENEIFLEDAEAQTDAVEAPMAPDFDTEGEIEALQAEIDALRGSNRALEDQMVRVNRQSIERVRESDKKLEQVMAAANKSQQSLPKLKNDLSEMTRRADRLDLQLEQSRRAVRDAESTAQVLNGDNRQLREHLEVSEAAIAERNAAIDSLKRDVTRLAHDLSDAQLRAESVQVERDEATNRAAFLEAALARADHKADKASRREAGGEVFGMAHIGEETALAREAESLRSMNASCAEQLADTLTRLGFAQPAGFPELSMAVSSAVDALLHAKQAMEQLTEAGTAVRALRPAVNGAMEALGREPSGKKLSMAEEIRSCVSEIKQIPILLELGEVGEELNGLSVQDLQESLTEAEATIEAQQSSIMQLEGEMKTLEASFSTRLAEIVMASRKPERQLPSVEYLTNRVESLERQLREAREQQVKTMVMAHRSPPREPRSAPVPEEGEAKEAEAPGPAPEFDEDDGEVFAEPDEAVDADKPDEKLEMEPRHQVQIEADDEVSAADAPSVPPKLGEGLDLGTVIVEEQMQSPRSVQ
ncbi:Chromosome partition protein Smc [Carpediemonas membranifera]|uniref:Chromosome partition protein Smc n=1 Tax=Carpediemonas membranifera TaxID=201153 RepID=A0A8J6E4C3_9EUKA|nr:Chromosome partition protein Smc [Carpediemonas membranifera]|eukprot:KAG9396746.1 Chromosome partition protein Smc [Carpediemonas membranifera]